MTKAQHTIRIISGTHRSRRLPVLDFDGLRPTGDRVREALFNWLQMSIVGKNVLDLCAGSGALGFEAASRGAKSVVLVEKHKTIANQLINIQKDFNFENVMVLLTNASHYLENCQQKFDLVFLDPPFRNNLMQELTNQVVPLVNSRGFIYREASASTDLQQLDKSWKLYRQKTYSQVKIELWQKQ